MNPPSTKTNEPDKLAQIVLRLPMDKKGRYVQAARAKGKSLGQWCEAVLDKELEK